MSAIYSQSCNFDSFLQKGVDPRTGQYTTNVAIYETPAAARNCPALQLSLAFNPLNSQDIGFGTGWSFNLSSYQHRHFPQTLVLSTGENFKVAETTGQVQVRDRKLKSFQFTKNGTKKGEYLVTHKSGSVEVLSNANNTFDTAVPIELWDANGRMLKLHWTYFGQKPRLESIQDSDQMLITISYSDTRVTIVRSPGMKEENILKITRRNNQLVQIQLPLENTPPWTFEYDIVGQFTGLKRITSPCGLQEEVTHSQLGHGHRLPPRAPITSIPYVIYHTVWPGHQQPATKTTYNYTSTNFLGFGVLNDWKDGEDNLYRVLQDYEYSCTVQVDGASSKYTYNRFHLLVRHERRQGTKKVELAVAYYMHSGGAFEKQPPQYQLPKSMETTYQDTRAKTSRTETTQHTFDEWGNPTQDVQPNGIQTDREYYPSGGAAGCPADPHGFQRYIKREIITPAPNEHQAPVRSREYSYSQHMTASSPYMSHYIAVGKVQSLENGQEISSWEYSYVDQPESRNHGRRQREVARLAQGYPMKTEWRYDYPDSNTLKRTTCTQSYDEYNAAESAVISMSSGITYAHTSIAGVQTDFEYDKIGNLIKKTVSRNTPYQASEEYWYSVLRGGVGYSVTVTNAKGVQVRYITDGLERICKVERQDADNSDHVSGGTFRVMQERSYNSYGQCVKIVDSDWLRTKGEPIEQKLTRSIAIEYDEWGAVCRVTNSSGAVTLSVVDPIGQTRTQGIEGQGKIQSTFNNFGLPTKTVLYKIDGSEYAKSSCSYDGLGRLVRRQDPLDRVTQYQFDCFDRITQTTGRDSQTVNTAYASHSASVWPVSIETNSRLIGRQSFDGVGRVTTHEVGGRTTTQGFDGFAPVPSTATTPKGDCYRLTHEPHLSYALMSRTSNDEEEAFQYDAQTAATMQLKSIYSTINLERLPSGLVAKSTLYINKGPTFSTSSHYSMAGKMQRYIDQHGKETEIQYNAAGNPQKLIQESLTIDFTYDDTNRLVESCVQDRISCNLTTRLTYDDFSREIGRTVTTGSKRLYRQTLAYLQTGHIATRRLEGGDGEVLRDENFQYDVLDRLVDYQCHGRQLPMDDQGNHIRHQTFTFGPYHNLTQISSTFQDGSQNVRTYTYSDRDPGQIMHIANTHRSYPATVSLKYNQNGCLILDEQGNELQYDSMSRLITVRDSESQVLSEYRYDASGKLICQIVPGKAPYYLHYRGNSLIGYTAGECSASFATDGTHYWGQTLQERDGHSQTQLWASDRHVSILSWVNTDKPDEIISRQYTPYGYSAQGNPDAEPAIGFNGEWRDPVTGWYHLGNGYRVYNTTLMAFHSPDSWSPFQSGEINPYGYCLGDPINNIDPSGHFSLFGIKFTWRDLAIAAAGLAVGIAFGVLTAGAGFAIEAGLGIAAGVASDVLVGTIYDQASGKKPTWQSVGTDALYGAIGGIAGEGIGRVAGVVGKAAVRGLKGLAGGAGGLLDRAASRSTANLGREVVAGVHVSEFHERFPAQRDIPLGMEPEPPFVRPEDSRLKPYPGQNPNVRAREVYGVHMSHDLVDSFQDIYHTIMEYKGISKLQKVVSDIAYGSGEEHSELWFMADWHPLGDVLEHATFKLYKQNADGTFINVESYHLFKDGRSTARQAHGVPDGYF